MKRFLALIAGLLATAALAQTNVTVPPPSCTAVVTCNSVTLTIPAPVTTPVPPPVPPAASSWVYHGGKLLWAGDWSFNAAPNYKDTAGAAPSGQDIAVTLTGQWGGWLPFAPGLTFNLAPYSAITFAFKPVSTGAAAQVFFVKANDIPVGTAVNPFSGAYGPAPDPTRWTTYRIPLSAFGVSGLNILKFAIQDQTGRSSGTAFYLDDVGFL